MLFSLYHWVNSLPWRPFVLILIYPCCCWVTVTKTAIYNREQFQMIIHRAILITGTFVNNEASDDFYSAFARTSKTSNFHRNFPRNFLFLLLHIINCKNHDFLHTLTMTVQHKVINNWKMHNVQVSGGLEGGGRLQPAHHNTSQSVT